MLAGTPILRLRERNFGAKQLSILSNVLFIVMYHPKYPLRNINCFGTCWENVPISIPAWRVTSSSRRFSDSLASASRCRCGEKQSSSGFPSMPRPHQRRRRRVLSANLWRRPSRKLDQRSRCREVVDIQPRAKPSARGGDRGLLGVLTIASIHVLEALGLWNQHSGEYLNTSSYIDAAAGPIFFLNFQYSLTSLGDTHSISFGDTHRLFCVTFTCPESAQYQLLSSTNLLGISPNFTHHEFDRIDTNRH